ncbi:GNAT family N-acetyltransferase [Glycomyces salinus]|uniref:GNAT family N-acetyltransferase n=1 Tax=Glycomyces salinus TaxID=980294 RepID=UPI0018EACAF0|nr:GNAT family N-acetyltransferase [Glycomyces salinus]
MLPFEPVTTPAFTLQPARGGAEPDCGFEPELVAVGPDGEEPWGTLGLTSAEGTVVARFWVAPERRGHRIAAAMLRAVCPRLFDSGTGRVETRAPVSDRAAIRAAMRAGFRPEGVLRAGAPDGTDALVLGLVPDYGGGPAPRVLPDLPGGELTDGAVALRPLLPDDFEAHLRHRTSPDVYAGAALPLPPSVGEVAEMCEWRAALEWLQGRSALMVIDDGDGYRGTIGLYHVQRMTGSGMIGYDLGAEARGRGYATRAVALVCRWAFGEVGLERVWAGTDVHNAASQAVLRRSGFRLEGLQRGGLPALDGSRRDMLLWARLSVDARD